MRKVLIANRGEIAVRIARACQAEGLPFVMVYSEADRDMPYLHAAERSICIGPPPATQSYLDPAALIMSALGTGCDAIHPGYGFLAENGAFATQCAQYGLEFIGPAASSIELMGDKLAARIAAERSGVPVVPGAGVATKNAAEIEKLADSIGYPLLIKASAGGGGRGMRLVHEAGQLVDQLEQAKAEAGAAFGDSTVYLERFFERVHHVEVQVFGDKYGQVVALGERECSVQRRHQKLVEEAPAPIVDEALRRALTEAAVRLAQSIDYRSAGTVEFIVDPGTRTFYFIEMNTRIQVEHPVTEAVYGVDLVREQLRAAGGGALSESLEDAAPAGHAVEWRITAEDPARGFLPVPGLIDRFEPPAGAGIRVDTFVNRGTVLSPFYDSLLAKLIVHGEDRQQALERSAAALRGFVIEGVPTTASFLLELLATQTFRDGEVHTRWLEETYLDQVLTS